MIPDNRHEIELEEVACPVCTSHRHRRHLNTTDPLHGVGGEFQVVRCVDCRHIFMNPVPTAESLAACYPAEYGPHAGPTAETTRPPVDASPRQPGPNQSVQSKEARPPWYLSSGIRRIPGLRRLYYWLSDTRSNYLPMPPGKDARAVELGCATGGFLTKLAQAGWEAEGVELIETAAAVAQQQGFPVHVGTLQSAKLPADTYDAAFAWMVIEHLPDPKSAFCELHRILKDNGQLAFSVPNVSCWEPFVFGRNWYVWEVPRHLQYFGPGRLRRILTDAGFDNIQIIHQRNVLNVIGSVGIALRKLCPNSRLARRLIDCPNQLSMWWQLLLAPGAIFLAMIRQGGRLTIVARCNKSRSNFLTSIEQHSPESV